jgi:hypothetical protein
MAITIAAATSKFIEIRWRDFRGQQMTKRIQLDGAVTDQHVIDTLTAFDGLSNAAFEAELVTRRVVSGMKADAINALERNISEVMELAFLTTNANGKLLTRTVMIPAMLANIENADGSPDLATNANFAALETRLDADLQYLDSTGTLVVGGFTLSAADSHHITLADIVDDK